ncbi:von Willebrand factor type A domain-containing protein [Olleya sp. UBA1516]|uniref:YfbK domain-containing protein n=1 Tax=Olleya sp. UBA1516 TaxID=1947013 RepID=UPI0025F4B024|nr:von Willebrand factor type A domain-containing protein [Olleya sp. UBA1516]|tara:strand:- start:120121 stop:122262 length:2142 start_codon:yes stop_codon:yes gene_type:complete
MKTGLNLIIALFMVVQLHAQQKTVSGVITDQNGLPLPSATVLQMGTANGTTSDFDGNYSISVKVKDVLVFSYLGYNSEQVVVTDANTINVILQENGSLDEVAITVLGISRSTDEVKKSVTTIQSEEIIQASNPNVVNSLAGKVSGLKIKTKNNGVNQTTRIVLRGNRSLSGTNEALIVIDGKISSAEKLVNLAPKKITSTHVVKGAEGSALYGSQGANGVIIVTTVDGNKENAKISKFVQTNKELQHKFLSESYTKIHENKFKIAATTPLSTFSIDVDKAGYSNVRRMINNGQLIPANAVKIEEMVNYFDYNYPQPTDEHPFSINTEVVKTPWHKDTKLVKIGLQGKIYDNENLPAANLTFLIDVSGSMGNQNKLPLLKEAFKLLVNQLRPQDNVAIVVYAGAAGVVLKPTSGKHKTKIIKALDQLNSGGSTAGGQGIELAYKLAQENFNKKGNNRVILATDGDFNVGASSNDAMEKLIVKKRESGVFLSVLGFGYGNYKDDKLEILADKGNGNHAYIDTMQEARRIFETEFGGTLFTIAKDVKIQVEFNPNHVQAYRLIGYENRLLADEDFVNDSIDAGELGAGHTVTALYEVLPVGIESEYAKQAIDLKYTQNEAVTNQYNDELFTVKFRYKKPNEDKSIEMIHVQKNETTEATEDMNFASAVALFGMQLRESQFYNNTNTQDVIALANKGRGEDKSGYRAEFVRLISTFK